MKLSDIISFEQLNKYDSEHLLDGHGHSLQVRAKYRELEQNLYEGLIVSYPISKVLSTIHLTPNFSKKCRTKRWQNTFAVIGEVSDFDFKRLLQILSQCGWFIAKMRFTDNDNHTTSTLDKDINLQSIMSSVDKESVYFELKAEAKYDIELERDHWPKLLYCLAPYEVRDKISKIGLVPKAGKNVDGQPERIYLGLDKDLLIKEMLPQLQHKNGTILITCNTSKFPRHVRLFDDPNYSIDVVYSVVNLPPICISSIEEIS